ncbi:MAG: hypothetical protein JST84_00785 [Acidobacteria bacterium]|nr:hypothetical protein [Acidobacteriota bacterium]
MSFDPNASGYDLEIQEQELDVETVAQLQREEANEEALADAVESGEIAEQPATAGPVITLAKRKVSGRYRGAVHNSQLELRVDVDGTRPMKRISGDLYTISGATTTYNGSFRVDAPTITVTTSEVKIEGTGSFSYTTAFNKIRVTLPRVTVLQPPAAATVRFFNAAGAAGAVYNCPFVSAFFRTVQLEQDRVTGTTLFTSYNTGALPHIGAARNLSVVSAYAEAGIEMQLAGVSNIVPPAGAGPDLKWTDSELHNAMVTNFSLWKNVPQWKTWLFLATSHVNGYRGIMFDYYDPAGNQRQGCAVFHNEVGGTSAEIQRAMLRTYVHELGHCFNLLHSWDKGRAGALSWMNYPWRYAPLPPQPGGEAAYWAKFDFQFDDGELIHLRHGFRNAVIMGGNNWAVGAGDNDAQDFAEAVEDNSGLKLEISARNRFAFAEPVVVELKLSTTDMRGKVVAPYLHPKDGLVRIGIRKPNGNVVTFRPLIDHCVEERTVTLDASSPSIVDSAYVGFGNDGFYFDQAGTYQVRAIYQAMDGSRICSNTISLRVAHPVTATDESVADLFLGEEQGILLSLLGSDSDFLKKGNDAFELVLDKYAKHPLASYAELVKGMDASQEFKRITPDRKIIVREPCYEEATRLLSSVADGGEIDRVTQAMVTYRLAQTQEAIGDEKAAKSTHEKAARKISAVRGTGS